MDKLLRPEGLKIEAESPERRGVLGKWKASPLPTSYGIWGSPDLKYATLFVK